MCESDRRRNEIEKNKWFYNSIFINIWNCWSKSWTIGARFKENAIYSAIKGGIINQTNKWQLTMVNLTLESIL